MDPYANAYVTVSNAAKTMGPNDRNVVYTALSATRVVTLPAAASVPPGGAVTIIDATGLITAAIVIQINKLGSDTIVNNFGGSAFVAVPYGRTVLISDGVSSWTWIALAQAVSIDGTFAAPSNSQTPSTAAVATYVSLRSLAKGYVLATTIGVNAKTVAATTLFTVPAAKTAVITGAIVRVTSATAITVGPTLGIGVAAGEADYFPSTTLTGLTVTTKAWDFQTSGLINVAAAGAAIKVGVDTAATGTSMTLAVDLLGYLV